MVFFNVCRAKITSEFVQNQKYLSGKINSNILAADSGISEKFISDIKGNVVEIDNSTRCCNLQCFEHSLPLSVSCLTGRRSKYGVSQKTCLFQYYPKLSGKKALRKSRFAYSSFSFPKLFGLISLFYLLTF